MYKRDGTPIQSAVTKDPSNYGSLRMLAPRLGVILEVRNADNPKNRSSIEASDFRGFLAEATVWLFNESTPLEHVAITPDSPTGLDNFEELLPRGCTKAVTGQIINSELSQIDPHDLDGDWCIVQFLEGNIQKPFISRYWPNPRNVYDCATSGKGNPSFTTGRGTCLDQRGRYFRRTNGVEYVITREGNVWISTSRAGAKIAQGASTDGRFPRLNNTDGGSILINIKPSQTFELSFNPQVDGIGSNYLPDDSLPQKNPAVPKPVTIADTSTKVTANKSSITVDTPITFKIRSKSHVVIESPNTVISSDSIKLGSSSSILHAAVSEIIDAKYSWLATAFATAASTLVPGDALAAYVSTQLKNMSVAVPGKLSPVTWSTSVRTSKVKVDE